jgi:hypothetical protein
MWSVVGVWRYGTKLVVQFIKMSAHGATHGICLASFIYFFVFFHFIYLAYCMFRSCQHIVYDKKLSSIFQLVCGSVYKNVRPWVLDFSLQRINIVFLYDI